MKPRHARIHPAVRKVLIIKLGYSETLDPEVSRTTSLGDVLRTTVILHAFRDCEVTWLVDEKAYPLLEGNPHIRRILSYDLTSVLQLKAESFDTVVNFEKVPGICALADSINAWRRFGFRFDAASGEARAYDGCERVFTLCKDTEEKRHHTESWQQMLMDIVGAPWTGQEYVLGYKPKGKVTHDVGFNHIVGPKWPTKAWPEAHWKRLEALLAPASVSWQKGLNNLYEYIEWVHSCRALVTTDSLGLHIALALRKPVVVLYGPTHANETYLYGRGSAIYPKGYDCLPCFSPTCHQPVHCLQTITPEQVAESFRALARTPAGAGA